ncbi:MAG: aconitate hydratase 1 [Acidobacteria bacterium RIFCSPLOWO2_12_FULL_59_11]|nr:MAG: aconitate hydratase 1 [Acidobacteria bacterium RIFCSPLOWO2_12_FULL_59_11]
MLNSFGTRSPLRVGKETYEIFRLEALEKAGVSNLSRLPFCLKILLENLLRNEDGRFVKKEDIENLARWNPAEAVQREIAFTPARVLLQDFTGVPAVADLAAMRDAMERWGGNPKKINPLQPAELVIDHSVQVDYFGTAGAFQANAKLEFERNKERYAFLRWAQMAFHNFRVVPPDTGIVHQVNLEYLARVVFRNKMNGTTLAYPDTLVGTDSHTTMINGLGVLGWGVGGIEAEAALLGQPISMLIPPVVGFKLVRQLPEGATATDLVLTITEILRKKGVVGKFVEFYGPGLSHLSLADRATLGNMAPEYGATIAISPIDEETLLYLQFSGRDPEAVELVRAYAKEQGLFRTPDAPEASYSEKIELSLGTVEPCLAGPRRPQDLVPLRQSKGMFQQALSTMLASKSAPAPRSVRISFNGTKAELHDGSVVVAAITSCTNTSNPSVMLGAGLLAKKAVEKGLTAAPWVKTSLAPGSKVVTDYLVQAGLMPYLEKLGFHLVGYGCTTCIGNSGPLPEPVSRGIKEGDLVAVAVLSGNRNFEGRIQSQVRANYLASPPLVVAYALAGRMDIDLYNEPVGRSPNGEVYLRDIWPSQQEILETVRASVSSEMFRKQYADVFQGDETWQSLPVPTGDRFVWDPGSTYVKRPPFFEDLPRTPAKIEDIRGGRVLAVLGDSVTTDHISPAGSIPADSPAGKYLIERGVDPKDFNSYGARRGNHEVMMRGTFANIRLRNLLVPGVEGGWSVHLPGGEQLTIFDAAMEYARENVPLLVLAGKEYGSGSSRDWAAKGSRLLGMRAVVAESFERIHRSNLVGMGILPLQFNPGENIASLGWSGRETYEIEGIAAALESNKRVTVRVRDERGQTRSFTAITRVDTPEEVQYYKHGGILPYVLRQLLSS